MKTNYYIVGIVALVLAGLGWYYFISDREEKMFGGDMRPEQDAIPGGEYDIEIQSEAQKKQPPQYCPEAHTLHNKNGKWWGQDGKWTHYTPSSATKIISFQGAQWVGIKVGKIICLYKTNEAAPFPMALEYTKARNVLEPRTDGWSATVGGNRRICKSANVVDCPYFPKVPKDLSNVYEEIKYAPREEF